MAAVPSLGRATEVEGSAPPEADATRALYERYAAQIYSFCLHRLGSREEAEDAVQTTFLNAFRGLRRGIVPEAESAWLFKIAENVCLTRHRSAWRRGRVESPSDMQALQDVTPARERDGDELIPLADALAAMPDTQQRAILLREWQGLSYREIANEMGVSQSAVETLIFRARRSLANGLEAPWPERPARRAGRRAFDLGSLLAGLKGLFVGGTAAKVAVVAIAAAGTAAVAVADSRGPAPSARSAEPSAADMRAPDSALSRAAVVAPAFEDELEESFASTRAAPPNAKRVGGTASPASAEASAPAAVETETPEQSAPPRSRRPETPPGQAKERGTPASPAVHPTKATKQKKAKPNPSPNAAEPKPKAEEPKPEKPKAEHPNQPEPKPEKPNAEEPKPAPSPPAPPSASGGPENDPGAEKGK